MYIEVATKIREYETKKFNDWLGKAETKLPLLMKNTLLVVSSNGNQTQRLVGHFICQLNKRIDSISQVQEETDFARHVLNAVIMFILHHPLFLFLFFS